MQVLREISRREFKKLKENNIVSIVGDTKLRKYKEGKHDKYKCLEYKDKKYLVKPDYHGITIKYFEVNKNEFVAVKSLLPFIILLCILLCFMLHKDSIISNLPTVGEAIEDYNEPTAETESITIPGLRASYNLSESNQEIYLSNPEGNTVNFVYTISENGKTVYKSGYVQPNSMVRANLYNILGEGEHSLDVIITTTDVETNEGCNSASLSTVVRVK